MAKPPLPPPPRSGYAAPVPLSGIPGESQNDGAAKEFADGFEAATVDLDAISLVDLDGEEPSLDQNPAPVAPPAPEPGARDLSAGKANLELALDRDPVTGQAKPPPPSPAPVAARAEEGGGIELDFAAAGISGSVKGQAAPGPAEVQPKAEPQALRGEPSQAGVSPEASPALRTGKTGLFGADRLTGFLVAGAIGLLVGIYPALQSARGFLANESEDKLSELEDAVDRPLAVRAGEIRAPQEIAAEIERDYDATRSRFWMVWLGVAIPVGLVLGLIRRRA